MHASQMQFGIEIETVAPDRLVREEGLRIGGYRSGKQVPYLPQGWTAEKDVSINNAGGGHRCEIVSPVLRGEAGIREVLEVIETLRQKGHRVNASCGIHIHVGWDRNWSTQALARLVTIVSYLERALYAITGTKTRERGRYCGAFGSTPRPTARNCARYNYRATLIRYRSCLKPVDTFRIACMMFAMR